MSSDARIRVTFVVPDLEIGGAERHVVTLVERLDRTRFQARVVCLGREGALFGEAAAAVPARALGHTKSQALRSVWALVRELREHPADVVVLRGYSAETVGRVAAVVARTPRTVVWVHNSFDLARRGRVHAIVDRVLEPVTDAYFGVSQQQLPYLTGELGHPPGKVRIIHNGVEVADAVAQGTDEDRARVRHELGLRDEDVVVGIFAGLRPEKDHETFLRAAARVSSRCPAARFLLVGDGPGRPALEKLAGDLGLVDRVVFAGFRNDVPAVLRAVDVVALSSWSEAFPMSLLEAMAAARPVVSTDVGGVSEIVEQGVTGLLVPPRDEVALSAGLIELVEAPASRASLGAAGLDRVRRLFTLERSVRQTENELRALVGAPQEAPAAPVQLTMLMDETGIGGVELVTLKMFAAFDRDVVSPHLVALRSAGPLDEEFRAIGVPVETLGRSGRFDVRTLPRLVRALREARTDVLLLAHHHRASLVLGRVAAALVGARVVVAAHDMDLVALGGRVLPASTVDTLRWVSALVLLSSSQGEYLHEQEGVGRNRRSRTREVVIPNGIPLPPPAGPEDRLRAREILGLTHEEFVVGIVARLSDQKAHHVLLRAFALLVESVPDSRLVVVGGGPREAELRTLADDLGIADRVLFTGLRRDVAQLLPGFDVSALSSIHEAAPITVIESMAAGLPVVATRCGALADMVQDEVQGILVPVGDVPALAAALRGLADRPELRVTMGAAARRRAEEEFEIDRTARGYEGLLRGLVSAR